MCGICGFTTQAEDTMQKMVQALSHRGPDSTGIFTSEHCSLGHARLAILDPTDRAAQPMHSATGRIVVVFNGEIYNYRELITKYSLSCRTTSDTEILLLLYELLGINFVSQLRGMFAFSLYDTHTNEVYLVRDSNGIKPLYYTVQNNVLFFASETKALTVAINKLPNINVHALSLYVRHRYVPRPYTLYEGMYSVDNGEIIHWKQGSLTKRYFRPLAQETNPKQYANIKDVMQNSINAHLISDKPLGLFLSGGLDSSVCLYHMSKSGHADINTFTVRFDVPNEAADIKFNGDANKARHTAALFETNHHEVTVSATDCLQAYEDSTFFLDQPNANPTAVIQYILSKHAKKSVDVVLTGIGGDELFAGYAHYRFMYIKNILKHVPPHVLRTVATLLKQQPDVWNRQTLASIIERLRLLPLTEYHKDLWTGDWFVQEANSAYIAQALQKCTHINDTRRFMEYDQYGWLIDEALRLADGSTMGAGLEARTPFIDSEVIAFANMQTTRDLLSVFTTKKMLRNAYTSVLPAEVTAFAKTGFFSPFAKWIRAECKPLLDEAMESEFLAQYFNMNTVRTIAKNHIDGSRYALSELTMLIQLHFWSKVNSKN